MTRRERAEMVVAWLESEGERGETVTYETVELAVRRNALDEAEHLALHREVLRVLRRRGYNVPDSAPLDLGAWALAGALCAALWVVLALVLLA